MPTTAPPPAQVRAPTPPALGVHGELAVAAISPSPLNPRKTFPAESLGELAASIREKGVLQPLLVRPVPAPGHPAPRWDPRAGWVGVAGFELVDGERRFRAAELAGLTAVPVLARLMSDAEVLEAMLVSNDQREDVRPSEQAAAYQALAAAVGAEEAARRVGKPVSQVRDLCRLAKLPAWALAAVDRGDLPRATAAVVARVPGEESRKRAAACAMLGYTHPADLFPEDLTRLEAGEDLAAGEWFASNSPISFRDAKTLVGHFRVELKQAPFSRTDAALVPAAGACDACPKRAGNDPELTAEGVRADTCTDPDCYRGKVEAYRHREAERFAKKWDITGPVEPVPEPFRGGRPPKGYCDLNGLITSSELGDGGNWAARKMDGDTVADVLAGAGGWEKGLPKLLGFDERGKPRVLVRTAEARKRLVAAGLMARPEKGPKADAPPLPRSPIEALIDAACGVGATPAPAGEPAYTLYRCTVPGLECEFDAPADYPADALLAAAEVALLGEVEKRFGRAWFELVPAAEADALEPAPTAKKKGGKK